LSLSINIKLIKDYPNKLKLKIKLNLKLKLKLKENLKLKAQNKKVCM
jgi:hypothetical protein